MAGQRQRRIPSKGYMRETGSVLPNRQLPPPFPRATDPALIYSPRELRTTLLQHSQYLQAFSILLLLFSLVFTAFFLVA